MRLAAFFNIMEKSPHYVNTLLIVLITLLSRHALITLLLVNSLITLITSFVHFD